MNMVIRRDAIVSGCCRKNGTPSRAVTVGRGDWSHDETKFANGACHCCDHDAFLLESDTAGDWSGAECANSGETTDDQFNSIEPSNLRYGFDRRHGDRRVDGVGARRNLRDGPNGYRLSRWHGNDEFEWDLHHCRFVG